MIYTLAQLLALTPNHFSGQKRYCHRSALGIYDTVLTDKPNESVAGIALIKSSGDSVVGWIYRTTAGRFYIQANSSMKRIDQDRLNLRVGTVAPRMLSEMRPLHSFASKHLVVEKCDSFGNR